MSGLDLTPEQRLDLWADLQGAPREVVSFPWHALTVSDACEMLALWLRSLSPEQRMQLPLRTVVALMSIESGPMTSGDLRNALEGCWTALTPRQRLNRLKGARHW